MKHQRRTMRINLPRRGEGVKTVLELKTRPTQDQIRQRAYEIHQARGDAPGRELDDWLQAECELKQEIAAPSTKNGKGPSAAGKPGASGECSEPKKILAPLGALGVVLALVLLNGCASYPAPTETGPMSLLYQANQQGQFK